MTSLTKTHQFTHTVDACSTLSPVLRLDVLQEAAGSPASCLEDFFWAPTLHWTLYECHGGAT